MQWGQEDNLSKGVSVATSWGAQTVKSGTVWVNIAHSNTSPVPMGRDHEVTVKNSGSGVQPKMTYDVILKFK